MTDDSMTEDAMAEEGRPNRLGRGLSALLGDDYAQPTAPAGPRRGVHTLPTAFLRANPKQPRLHFAEAELDELAASLRERGVLQPILVRPVKGETDAYEIVAGERRWRAAQKAMLHEVPVIIRELTDAEALEVALIENIQRADLNPMEEALGYQALITEYQYSQETLARILGKSRPHIGNMIRLLSLPERVRNLIVDGKLSAGHVRPLIGLEAPRAIALAEEMVTKNLSVRGAEALVRNATERAHRPQNAPRPRGGAAPVEKDADLLALERSLGESLGLKVEIDYREDGSGAVTIAYRALDQLDEIIRRLSQR
jgi:ParB family chromosome partitioning protein